MSRIVAAIPSFPPSGVACCPRSHHHAASPPAYWRAIKAEDLAHDAAWMPVRFDQRLEALNEALREAQRMAAASQRTQAGCVDLYA